MTYIYKRRRWPSPEITSELLSHLQPPQEITSLPPILHYQNTCVFPENYDQVHLEREYYNWKNYWCTHREIIRVHLDRIWEYFIPGPIEETVNEETYTRTRRDWVYPVYAGYGFTHGILIKLYYDVDRVFVGERGAWLSNPQRVKHPLNARRKNDSGLLRV